MPLDVSQVYLGTPGTVLRSATAAQSVSAFTQNADALRISTGVIDVSQVWLGVPDTSLPTRNASATQTVGVFAQTATMFDVVGQINGGGTITEGLPHRTIGGTQSVGIFQQSAAVGPEGGPAPRLASSTHNVPAFTQTALADARAQATANQAVGEFRTQGLMFEPPVRVRSGGGYASVSKRGKRFYAQVGDVTVSADTLAELQRKVSRLQAEQAEDAVEPARKALPAPKVTKVADPVAEPPAPVPAEQVDAMVAQFIAQQQALVDQYQREVEQLKLASLANTAALRASMQQEVEQRVAQASADMDAVVALMMDEPVPMSVAAPQIQVMLPKALPAKKDAREKRVEKQSRVAEMGAQISKTLGDLVASALTERTKEVEPLQNEIKRLNEELSRVTEQSSAKRRVVRENGKVTGVMVGDEFRPVERDEAGRIVGI